MIKGFKPRLYQQTIFATASTRNTLVVLPTGLGKTKIFLMLTMQRLKQYPNSKILFLGPTRPLIKQYYDVFVKFTNIPEEKLTMFTGHIKPEKREELWKEKQIIFSTPQGLENDIISGRINLEEVSLLGFDECHRAVKEYSYVWIAKQYHKGSKYERILGLTASPGHDLETISEVCKNLYIEEIESRIDTDPDVKPYVQDMNIEYVKVNLPESFKSVKKYLEAGYKSKLKQIQHWGYVKKTLNPTKKQLLMLQRQLHSEIVQGNKSLEILKSVSLLAEGIKVQHALELLETQGITALNEYIEKLVSESYKTKVKATQNLVRDLNFKSARALVHNINDANVEHPKLSKLKQILKEEKEKNPNVKVIIFNQYRDSAVKILEEVQEIIPTKLFVGQAKRKQTGLTQKEQIKMLDEFREGQFNCLISTSIGEEGLDIPQVDLVIFYESVPSAIRTVQRRGRTGRLAEGRVITLVTQGTRDEAYRWTAHHKEKRMIRTLKQLKQRFKSEVKREKPLTSYIKKDEIKVYVDYREKGSGVIKELIEFNSNIKLDKLEVADYIVSSRCGIEYKTTNDFVESIIDGRLLQQVKDLKKSFERPLIIIEGQEDIYSIRKIHPNAIRGMLATITISYGIPVLYTKNFKETAGLINIIAKREQTDNTTEFTLHTKKPLTLKEQQEYIISALPGVGITLAKPLLRKFKSIKKIINANQDELKQVEQIGDKKAKHIKDVIDKEYLIRN